MIASEEQCRVTISSGEQCRIKIANEEQCRSMIAIVEQCWIIKVGVEQCQIMIVKCGTAPDSTSEHGMYSMGTIIHYKLSDVTVTNYGKFLNLLM